MYKRKDMTIYTLIRSLLKKHGIEDYYPERIYRINTFVDRDRVRICILCEKSCSRFKEASYLIPYYGGNLLHICYECRSRIEVLLQ